jgi:putative tryptophan/tyrosine transport system substrate-binding protein
LHEHRIRRYIAGMLRHALRIFFLYYCLLPASWAGSDLALVLSEDTAPYKEFASSLTEFLQPGRWNISTSTPDKTPTGQPPNLMITVGIEAFRQSLQRSDTPPIIATMIGRKIYLKLLAESGRPRQRSTAIYIEQPLARQAAFIRHILPGKTRAGILLSNESRSEQAAIRQAFTSAGYTLDTEDSEADESLLLASNALFERIDFLFATPDPKIYRRDQIKTLLLNSYRHQKPVIAFSPTFVTAGALAAIYSTPKQIARQTADLLNEHGSNLQSAQYPQQFSIAINRSVANALNIQLADEATIRRALMTSKEFQ